MIKVVLNQVVAACRNHPLRLLALFAAGIFGVHLTTVAEYPVAWFDEIEILEMGRFSIFDVYPEWSVNLFPLPDGSWTAPAPYFHYLAGLVLEGLYRLSGGFLLGRSVMLLSLPCCALALFGWLRTKKIPPAVSLFVACLMLVDPNATICAHWYRPDLWCMTLVFLALQLLAASSRPLWRGVLAGVLSAIAVCFWLTAVLFLPLVLLETLTGTELDRTRHWRAAQLNALGAVTLGGVGATALLLVPLYPHLGAVIGQYMTHSEVGQMSRAPVDFSAKVLPNTLDFLKIACRSPWVWILAGVGVVGGRRLIRHGILFLFIVAFIIATRVYHLRMVYLMPFVFLFTAEALRIGMAGSRVARNVVTVLAALALVWGCGISVCALTIAAWPGANTLDAFSARLAAALPQVSPRVYLYDFEHESYYAGRRLGWKMYSYTDRPLIFQSPHDKNLDKLDAVLISAMEPPLTDQQKSVLTRHGFTPKAKVVMPSAIRGPFHSRLAGIFYVHGYPTCEVWTR